ncbi:MAG: AtpZ/AtpI family protein [Phaeodactylibacter sp.]|nr:AtpZ/AtpI family protein [Phaeodactylibacter sp.]
MAVQLGLVIAIGTFAGSKIDERLQTERPYFTALLALVALAAGLYLVLKDLFVADSSPEKEAPKK